MNFLNFLISENSWILKEFLLTKSEEKQVEKQEDTENRKKMKKIDRTLMRKVRMVRSLADRTFQPRTGAARTRSRCWAASRPSTSGARRARRRTTRWTITTIEVAQWDCNMNLSWNLFQWRPWRSIGEYFLDLLASFNFAKCLNCLIISG